MVALTDSDLEKLPVNGVGPLVLVRWVDITGYGRWTPVEEVTKALLPECETVGRILYQDEKILRIAATRDPYGKVEDCNLIPMQNVLAIVYLRPYNKKKEAVRESAPMNG